MNDIEILKRRLILQKQWLWMLSNLSDKELQLPRNTSKQDALNEALDEIRYIRKQIKRLNNE